MLSPAHTALLREINQRGPLSRTELTRLTGSSKANISNLAADLLQAGVLAEQEMVYGAGRPAIRLGFASDAACFLGVSLSADGLLALLTDPLGRPLAQRRAHVAPDLDAIGACLAQIVEAITSEAGVDRAKLMAVGVALPGLVDAAAGRCLRSTLLGWRDVDVTAALSSALGLAVHIENDAHALALGEHLFGQLRGIANGTVIAVGDGIGCGHIIGGAIHRGRHGGAGEIAHATIVPGGLPCLCGKRGCLDTLASTRAIAGHAAQAGLQGGLAELERAAARGEREALRILHEAGSALGLAISHIVQSLDPERVVITFTDCPTDGLYARAIRQTIEANVMPRGMELTDIAMLAIEDTAWARGAASLATGKVLFAL